jgi:predicted HTH domain antitoxin
MGLREFLEAFFDMFPITIVGRRVQLVHKSWVPSLPLLIPRSSTGMVLYFTDRIYFQRRGRRFLEMEKVVIPLPMGITSEEAELFLAIKLFEEGKLSLGQAAQMARYSKRAFMEILGKHGVCVFDHPAEELERDLQNA